MPSVTAKSGSPFGRVGGVAIGVTSVANSAITTSLTLRSAVGSGENKSNKVRSASSGSQNIATATSGGRLSYDPVRDFLINGFSTTINGSANNVLRNSGTVSGSNRKAIVSKVTPLGVGYRTAIAAGYMRPLGIANQRSIWSTPPAALNSNTYKSTTSAVTTAVDKAVPSLAVPGNLLYRTGKPTTVTTTYKSFYGP